jgi:uncharacterized protein YndB with AHSA1/START domain
MTMNEHTKTQLTLPSDREIVVSRSFAAPRDLVWNMWTQAEHLKHWWGPKGWTLPVCEVDFRPGGTWFYCMEGPDGTQACGKATYGEIDEPNRFVYADAFADTDGSILGNMPQSQVTVEFIEDNGKTTVVSTAVYASKANRDQVIDMGMEAGIDQTLDRLEAYLSTVN